MGDSVKFSSKMDAEVLEALRAYADRNDRTVAGVVTEAVNEYLQRAAVRPAFRDAAEAVMQEHDELLERLAK